MLSDDPRFKDLVARHKNAAERVSAILSWDHDSLDALKEAERARSFAARTLEQGESTLAAYRRVVAPPVSGATLVNRKGRALFASHRRRAPGLVKSSRFQG